MTDVKVRCTTCYNVFNTNKDEGKKVICPMCDSSFSVQNTNIVTSIKDIFTTTPEISILADSDLTSGSDIVPEIKYIEQVYHIPNNKYTYENIQPPSNRH
jgi:hypothetical protein